MATHQAPPIVDMARSYKSGLGAAARPASLHDIRPRNIRPAEPEAIE